MTFLTEAEYTYAVSGGKKAAGLAKKTKIRASVLEKKKKRKHFQYLWQNFFFSPFMLPFCLLKHTVSARLLKSQDIPLAMDAFPFLYGTLCQIRLISLFSGCLQAAFRRPALGRTSPAGHKKKGSPLLPCCQMPEDKKGLPSLAALWQLSASAKGFAKGKEAVYAPSSGTGL